MAVDNVKAGILSVRKAFAHFGVPKSTISDRVTGKVASGAKPGRSTVFPMEFENDLAEKI